MRTILNKIVLLKELLDVDSGAYSCCLAFSGRSGVLFEDVDVVPETLEHDCLHQAGKRTTDLRILT